MTTTETVQIQMPQMGESVTEGTVLQWHKQEGEFVDEGETVVEVSTDKVDAETPAPASGTISKVLKAEDETVEVGAALAELDPSGAPSGNGASGEAPAEDSAPPAEDPAAPGREAEDGAGVGPGPEGGAPARGACRGPRRRARSGGRRGTLVPRRAADRGGSRD